MFKLMIVDDEPIILAGIRDMIESQNTPFTKIVTAQDGFEALEKLDYFYPDLIITDIQMPEMDGLEFIRHAKSKLETRFIILSGYDVFEYARKAIHLQVVEYLLKPINEQELNDLLKRMAIDIMASSQQEESKAASENPSEGSYSEHVKMLLTYIHSNYRKDISLSDAAAYLKLHPVYTGQLFKKETGKTFVHYIHSIRMKKAKELLADKNAISLEKIAACVGYENRRTFYKVFNKYVGLTPGQYRESCIAQNE
ncbi:two-component system response regulator YesN [Paenibacillus phyllosphaerae]|uniref:Two-component system response regulator YesN n=1 Tax=Paenibacillus phyllosphaerae TaxID=274593 RepID=A0A7W5B0C0_9BACL|nr:response regulator [Paenibacillus phyllosphaerae]MBB3112125.1 two-component system response regulator YesN [Paenibacillus phyllosphaerae]